MYENCYLSPAERRLPYFENDTLLRKRAVNWVFQNPKDAAYIQLRKLTYMWGVYPIVENDARQVLFGNVPILFILVVAALLFLSTPGLRTRLARLWLPAVFVSGVALISWGSWRFRQPADPGLLAFVVCGLWLRWAFRTKYRCSSRGLDPIRNSYR